jgi:hypothetical protein
LKPKDVLNTAPLAPLKQITKRLVLEPMRNLVYIRQSILADDEAQAGGETRDVTVLRPAERLLLADPAADPFVPVSKYYREGWCDHPAVFACRVPDARVHLPTGMICTRSFRVLADRGLEDRLGAFAHFGGRKPAGEMRRLDGPHATVNYCLANNFWHWMVDCLPRIHALDQALPDQALTLLMPPRLLDFQRETLAAVLPPRFRLRNDIAESWVQCGDFRWASLVSGRCMGKLPDDYLEAIRSPIFRKLGLEDAPVPRQRLYLSRKRARHRRVTNEETLLRFLAPYGFREIELENLSFTEQVRLFREAAIVLGPHGAGLGGIFFAGEIDVVALYPTRVPPNYFHTLALGLRQRHHFVCHDEKDEDDSFAVDIPALKVVLEGELGLRAGEF